jgi:hypothetical protein
MKRTLIGINQNLKQNEQRDARQKLNSLNKAIELFEKAGIPITDLEAFRTSFTNYFENYVRNENKLFKNVPKERLYELFNMSYRELYKLEREFLTNRIQLDKDNNPIYSDYNIYAETKKELEVYNAITSFAAAVKGLETSLGRTFNRNDINQTFKGVFDMFEYTNLKPNNHLIKSAQ